MIRKITGANISQAAAELRRMMRDASEDLSVREFALQVVPVYGEDQITPIYNYAKRHIRYQPDPVSAELFISPKRMIEKIQGQVAAGDCDDIALFCASLYRALGMNARIVLLDQTGDWSHAACEVFSIKLGEWVYIDPTDPNPVGWTPTVNRRMEVA